MPSAFALLSSSTVSLTSSFIQAFILLHFQDFHAIPFHATESEPISRLSALFAQLIRVLSQKEKISNNSYSCNLWFNPSPPIMDIGWLVLRLGGFQARRNLEEFKGQKPWSKSVYDNDGSGSELEYIQWRDSRREVIHNFVQKGSLTIYQTEVIPLQ
ncbi:uncharacterized protein BDR25DRAFT_349794 [Lindgomyces ingoldianus]|uniref:Uncharacterized protein n=1 Tax=Lindgomyces ingoldianus TaxID=673940 RepID=A0ACB6RBN3_9PLEO|nr:uncharacterized protein BDR25DRAFT_349794 [Lindgomyces ingoldianus]KAF2476734.1 hypothetical protein BDR25DRAFT_349794 [Lindgomyces ingoldianus]